MNSIWKVVRKFKNRMLSPRNYNSNDDEINNNMIEFIQSYCPPSAGSLAILNEKLPFEYDQLDSPILEEELYAAVDSLKKDSSPGLDQITNKMLENTPDIFKKFLLHVFNQIFDSIEYFPSQWRDTLLILIPKNNLPESQNGFRRGKSAFDNVLPTKLQEILCHFKIPLKIRTFIHKLMTLRLLYLKVKGDLSGSFVRDSGAPQGRVLSPLLYNIYIIFLDSVLKNNNGVLQFADDTLFYNSNKVVQNAIDNLQNNLPDIMTFFSDLGLPIAPEKTKLIIFDKSKNAKKPEEYSIIFDNQTIKGSENIKYLGLILNYRLNWQNHINYISEKALKSLSIIKALRGTWWGGHPQVLLNLYKSLTRSIMEYNIFLLNQISLPQLNK